MNITERLQHIASQLDQAKQDLSDEALEQLRGRTDFRFLAGIAREGQRIERAQRALGFTDKAPRVKNRPEDYDMTVAEPAADPAPVWVEPAGYRDPFPRGQKDTSDYKLVIYGVDSQKKISTIKALRNVYQCGVREAKDVIDFAQSEMDNNGMPAVLEYGSFNELSKRMVELGAQQDGLLDRLAVIWR